MRKGRRVEETHFNAPLMRRQLYLQGLPNVKKPQPLPEQKHHSACGAASPPHYSSIVLVHTQPQQHTHTHTVYLYMLFDRHGTICLKGLNQTHYFQRAGLFLPFTLRLPPSSPTAPNLAHVYKKSKRNPPTLLSTFPYGPLALHFQPFPPLNSMY